MQERINKVFKDAGSENKVTKLTKLHGDASYRAYYRAELDNGETRIIMQMPPGKSSVSEEITNFSGKHAELPFININKFLHSINIPVPKIYYYSDLEKLMILEDIGNDMLIGFNGIDWYKKAIDLLSSLQKKTKEAGDADCVALKRSFDATLLNWEFDHFREYFIEERCGIKMNEVDRLFFEKETRKITEEIQKIPYCFTHRDFQSKNIMIRKDGSLVLIDFQDALMGPLVYDLVALLRDSYVELEAEMLDELLNYYSDRSGLDRNYIRTAFDLMTIQRKMKDAGRFIFIDRVKKNPNFLQYIPTTLRYINDALKRASKNDLHEMLKKYVTEWK